MKKISLLFLTCASLLTQQLSAQAPCTGARRDLASMTATERGQLRDAIVGFLRSETNTAFPSSALQYYTHVAHHANHFSMVHNTGTKIFFTWHRYYIQEMEHWFLENGYQQFVPLPAWNPNATPMVPNEFFSGPNAITASQYGSLSSQNSNPPSNTNYVPPASCGTTNENTFAANTEGIYHNPVHNNISGTMGTPHSSAAAIFWPWHGYVDDLWYCYQRNCKNLKSDLYVKKYNTDEGVTPVPSSVQLWTAPDIWVRNNPDGFVNRTSENLTNTHPTDKAYVYVKVMNRGAAPNQDGTGDITTYWAQGSVGVQWPNPWTGSGPTITCDGVARPLGGPIGSKPLRRVNENFTDPTHTPAVVHKDYYIYEFEWDMPDPDNYSCFTEVWEQQHFCILARMNDELGTPTSSNIYNNMTASNNIAMRNVTILKDDIQTAPGVPKPAPILWGNYTNATVANTKLMIRFDNPQDAQLLGIADLTLKVDNATRQQWLAGGAISQEVVAEGNVFRMRNDGAFIAGFTLPPNTVKGLTVAVTPRQGQQIDREYKFDLVQYNDDRLAGGERYIVQVGNHAAATQSATANIAAKEATSDYQLYPNPAQNSFAIQYAGNKDEQMKVAIYDHTGRMLMEYEAVASGQELTVSTLPAGVYMVKIINQKTNASSTQKLVISR